MNDSNQLILDDQLRDRQQRRRELLPTWIKVFIWIFLVFGAIVPIVLVLGLTGLRVNIALYGLETIEPYSYLGLLIISIFILKGLTAFGLWWEKDWGVNLAIVDAILGICICGFVMLIIPLLGNGRVVNFNIRLELIPLIPYLFKMLKIRLPWMAIKKN